MPVGQLPEPDPPPQPQAPLCRSPPITPFGRSHYRPATGRPAIQRRATPGTDRCTQHRPAAALGATALTPSKADDAPPRLGHTCRPFSAQALIPLGGIARVKGKGSLRRPRKTHPLGLG